MVAWSGNSVASQWVRNEALEGMDRNVLVPILLDQVRLPVAFKQQQIADFTEWPEDVDTDQYQHLLGTIHRLVRGEAIAPGGARHMSAPHPRARRRKRKYLVSAFMLAVVALAAILVFDARSPSSAMSETRVTLNRFAASGNDDSTFYADSLTRELQRSLESIKGIDLVRVGSIWDLNWNDVPQAILSTSADYVVSGNVAVNADDIDIALTLTSAHTGKVLWTQGFKDQVANLADVQQQLMEALMAEIKLTSTSPVIFKANPGPITRDKIAYRDYLIGQDLLRRGEEQNVRKAISRFDSAISRDPAFVQALASNCHAYLELFRATKAVGDFNAGKQDCQKVLSLDKSSLETHLALAELYRTSGKLELARLQYLAALDLGPTNPDAEIGLADVLVKQGDLQGGEALYKRAVNDNPTYWKAHNALATYYFRHGMFNRAIEGYTRVTQLTGANAVAFSNLGAARLYAGDFDGASNAWRRANQLDTNSASFSNLGTALYYEGKFTDALKQYRAALAMDPDDHRLWGNVADNLRLIPGNEAEARKAYLMAISLVAPVVNVNPDDAYALSRLSVYYAAIDDQTDATGMATRAEKLAGLDLNVLYDLAVSSALLGDRVKARGYITRALNAGYPAVLLESDPQLKGIEVTK